MYVQYFQLILKIINSLNPRTLRYPNKSVLVFILFAISVLDSIGQSQYRLTTSNSTPSCYFFETNATQLVGTDNFIFKASINNQDSLPIPAKAQMGCIIEPRNPRWVLIKVLSGSQLTFNIASNNNLDIDAAIWGPVTGQDISNTCDALNSFPLDCQYDTLSPVLNLSNAIVNNYYLLMVSNFANDNTEVSIGQPIGGVVKYYYYCPENIQLNTSLSGGQNQYAKNTIKLGGNISSQSNVQAFSGNAIELLPGFSSGEGVVFESKIQDCNLVQGTYVTPTNVIPCESFDNHTTASPHLYANTLQNELVGTVYAKNRPQYRIGNQWFDMKKLGKDKKNDRYLWFYRHPFTVPNNVSLRTGPNCPHYDDVRYSQVQSYLGTEDTPLPNLEPVTTFLDIDSPFYLSTNITESGSYQRIEALYLKYDVNSDLNYSINGGSFRFNVEKFDGFEPFSNRHLRVARIGQNDAPKDFIIDFRINRDAALDRYIVTRNTAGGHFAVNTTFTRLADSTVYVTTFQGDMDTQMKLGPYEPTELFGCTFYLGKLPEGTYYFPLTSRKEEVVLDEQIMVRVRYN
ncbi:hypothetical protein SAMN06298216_0942 [Spirosomataceae bacterium TFI 002]|nr:hypothetical protein SAMN06298216_0942 [Spirosomataceae bacterium TFI 002]